MMLNRIKILIGFIFCLIGFVVFADTIVVGGKKFTEQTILAEIMAQKIENDTKHVVTRRFHLGATNIAFTALLSGDIDIYPEYTGTGWVVVFKQSVIRDSEETYQRLKKLSKEESGIDWGKPFGFNNTYALGVRQKDKKFQGIKKVSELGSSWDGIKFGVNHDFYSRPDGLPGLLQHYGATLNFSYVKSLDSGLMYQSVRDGEVDMIAAFSTDGRIKSFDLKLLEDDKNYFPPYFAAPIYKVSFAEKYPEVIRSLDALEGTITAEAMQKMNQDVDENAVSVEQVAAVFLKKNGFVKEEMTHKDHGFWVQNGESLWKYFLEHLSLVLFSMVFALIVALPLGVVLMWYPRIANQIFAVASIIQTIPSIALLGFLIPIFGIGFKPAVVALFLYSLLPIMRNTYVGIKQVDPHLIEVTEGLGLTDWEILRYVKVPLAMPMIMAGIRTSVVINVGTATVAAMIGAGGFGEPILRGVNSVDSQMILLGAVPAALMAIIFDRVLQVYEERWKGYLA